MDDVLTLLAAAKATFRALREAREAAELALENVLRASSSIWCKACLAARLLVLMV